MESKLEFYNKSEIKKFIESKTKYVYVDDGYDEVIIAKKDIPDFIVYVNRTFFLWVTFPCLLDGIRTIKEWGFKYKTCGFTWVKRNK